MAGSVSSWQALANSAARSRDYNTSWYWYYHAVRTFRDQEAKRTGRRPGYMEARRDPRFREAWRWVGRGRIRTTRKIERAARQHNQREVSRLWLEFRESEVTKWAFDILGQEVPRGEQYLTSDLPGA